MRSLEEVKVARAYIEGDLNFKGVQHWHTLRSLVSTTVSLSILWLKPPAFSRTAFSWIYIFGRCNRLSERFRSYCSLDQSGHLVNVRVRYEHLAARVCPGFAWSVDPDLYSLALRYEYQTASLQATFSSHWILSAFSR